MKTIDLKSLLIGFLSTIILFMTLGMRQTVTNMGDIAVNSITVIGENEEKALFIGSGGGGNGYLKTYNKFGKTSSYLGTGGGGTGGGAIHVLYGGTLTNNGSIAANGGGSGGTVAGVASGGTGGAGGVNTTQVLA